VTPEALAKPAMARRALPPWRRVVAVRGTRGADRYDSPAGVSAGEAQLTTAVGPQPTPDGRRWPSPWNLAAIGLLGFAVLRAADRLDG
jgi:hypothetical protein